MSQSASEREAPASEADDARCGPKPSTSGGHRADRLGELLPDSTRDESAVGWGDEDGGDPDEHLRREVPPHHG